MLLRMMRNPETRERGFRIFIELYQEKTYWHIRRMVLSHEDANDVIQNTFIKAYKHLNSFNEDSKLYTWIYRIATNESISFLRKKQKNNKDSLDESPGVYEQLKADPYFDGDHSSLLLQEATARLPEKQKLVFQMRYFEDMNYKDISEILETSIGSLKASYHHAVKKVEAFLKS